jgi:ankyrin repeat protein
MDYELEDPLSGPNLPIHSAAAKGDVTEITRRLEAGDAVNARNMASQTPLHYAVEANKPEAVRLLLSKGADATLKTVDGYRNLVDDAVLHAARFGAVEAMEELVSWGVELSSHAVPLAASCGNFEIVLLLLDTITLSSAEDCQQEVVDIAIIQAARNWVPKVVQALFDRLRKINGSASQKVLDSALLAVYSEDRSPTDLLDFGGETDWSRVIQTTRLLVDAGADVNTRDPDTLQIPLHLILQQENLPPEVITYLVQHGGNLNALDYLGCTPTFYLLTHVGETTALTELLIKRGRNVHIKNLRGDTPLHGVQSVHVAQLLVAHGADPPARNDRTETPLHAPACSDGLTSWSFCWITAPRLTNALNLARQR